MKKIIIFASGSGSNAEQIITYFKDNKNVEVGLILSNNPKAGVLERAKKLQVPSIVFDRQAFYHSEIVLDILRNQKPDLIVLAGFLWKFPENIIDKFPNKIINIHPALLPKYGGKGMYGSFVHQAVIENKETKSGITIHYVNENYDEGAIIFQTETEVTKSDTTDSLAQKIHQLEYNHFPKIIASLLQ